MILWAYQIIYPLVAIGVLFHLIFSGRGKILNEGRADILERLGLPAREALAGLAGGRVLWLHAASVGEVIAAGPIIKQITSSRPDLRLLLTTSTVAGRSRGRSISEVTACVLLPIDFYPAITAFLRRTRPNALLLIEKEFWPMMLKAVTNRMIPCGIVNGRITAKSAKRYALLSGIFRPLLKKIDRAAVQTDEDKNRFIALGIRESAVAVTGNSKYDTPKTSPEARKKINARLASLGWNDAVVFVAGSTRKGEEEIILEAFLSVNRKDPRLKLILAPRHLERIDEVTSVLREKGVRFLPWSEPLQSESAPNCVLLDEMGLLADIYSIGSFAFVGGTLVPVGGHNLLEPAFSGVPVLFGPHTDHTRVVASALLNSGGGLAVKNSQDVSAVLLRMMTDASFLDSAGKSARTTAQSFIGAAQRTLSHLAPLISPN